MTELCLQENVVNVSQRAMSILQRLNPADPVRDWYEYELHKLTFDPDRETLSLVEANSRLAALHQLIHLIREHSFRVQNPEHECIESDFSESYHTVLGRMPSHVLDSARDLGFSISPALLHEHGLDANERFDPVSPTAKIVGYLRSLDKKLKIDSLSPTTDGESLLHELGITSLETQACMAVLFQSRYHAMNVAISGKERGSKQILELAAGISPRGYQWAKMNPDAIYVESDLPQLMIHKAKLVRNAYLENKQRALGAHHCCGADVLDLDSVLSAINQLDTRNPFTLVTEGLLLYFDSHEMESFLDNIRSILSQYPQAVWVTDFVSQADISNLLSSCPKVAKAVRSVFSTTGRSVVGKNPFETEDDIRAFLDRFQLRVDSVVDLRSAAQLLEANALVPPGKREQIVGQRKIWRIRVQA